MENIFVRGKKWKKHRRRRRRRPIQDDTACPNFTESAILTNRLANFYHRHDHSSAMHTGRWVTRNLAHTVNESAFSSRLYDDRSAILVTPRGLVSLVDEFLVHTDLKHFPLRSLAAQPLGPGLGPLFHTVRALGHDLNHSAALFTREL